MCDRMHTTTSGVLLEITALDIVVGLVPHTGFEPVISALRGRCPGPLDECGTRRRTGREYSKRVRIGPARAWSLGRPDPHHKFYFRPIQRDSRRSQNRPFMTAADLTLDESDVEL